MATIKKGHHWAQWWFLRFPLFYGDEMVRIVRFDSSINYNVDPEFQAQLMKLIGFSIGWHPMKENVRFVFRNGFCELLDCAQVTSFIHRSGKHDAAEMDDNIFCTMFAGTDYLIKIRKENVKGKTLLHFYDSEHQYSIQTEIPYSKWGWKLYTYFGGDPTAPQDIHISIINPNSIMKKTIDSIFKHYIFSLFFLLVLPLVIIWIVYSERVPWPVEQQWSSYYYWVAFVPVIIYIFFVLPLLRSKERGNSKTYNHY